MDRKGEQHQRLVRTVLVLLGVIGAIVAFAVWFYRSVVPDTGDAALSGHGVTALILGVVFTLALGIGLMALLFLSSRRGYDEEAAGRRDGGPPQR